MQILILLLMSLIVSCTNKPVNLGNEQDLVIKRVAKSAETKHYYAYAAMLREKYMERHPEDILGMQDLYKDFEYSAQWQKSLYLLNKLSKKKPKDINIILHQGHAYLHLGLFNKAFDCYKFVLDRAPDISAYNGMGVILNAGKHYDLAKQCFDSALALDPTNDNTINNKALTLALAGEPKHAQELLENLAAIYPKSAYSDNLNKLKDKDLWHHLFGSGVKVAGKLYTCKKN